MREPPSPSALATDLHQGISGKRELSRWLAGQLLDSALLRAVAALDRVAAMLHLCAGLPLETARDGSARMPAFNAGDLGRVRPAYNRQPQSDALFEVVDHPVYQLLKRFRNGNTHQRRWPSELHGERTVLYWDDGPATEGGVSGPRWVEGLSAQDHFAVSLAVWNLVLRPAVELGGSLVESVTVIPEADA